MPSDDLKKRIEALNKRPLKNVPEKPRRIVEPKAAPAPAVRQATPKTRNPGPRVTLEEAVEGVVTAAPSGPGYYHIELTGGELDPCARELHECFVPLLGDASQAAATRISAVCNRERIAPEEVVFLDIETTGLSNTPLFLIGTMDCGADGFSFSQYFARDYSEEASILSAFSQRLKDARMIVTFNGKSFDVPYMRNRAVATGVSLPHPKSHLDLLHEARRNYGRTVPNHKLQTLEQLVCGRHREGDIPSAQIPAAYHEFVRTGNAHKIGVILRHNLHDLLTMADLMSRMWGGPIDDQA